MEISKVDGLLAEMRAAMAVAQGKTLEAARPSNIGAANGVSFAGALKSAIDGVAQMQNQSEAMQKANIAFQTAIQVRNKVVAAYNDIMNMQV